MHCSKQTDRQTDRQTVEDKFFSPFQPTPDQPRPFLRLIFPADWNPFVKIKRRKEKRRNLFQEIGLEKKIVRRIE